MKPQRSSDVVETFSSRAIGIGILGIVLIGIGFIGARYPGMWTPLGWTLIVMGVGCIGFAVFSALQVKKVPGERLKCPYCQATNILTEPPTEDFSCHACHRMIPVLDGQILQVFQVRCGYCNHLNFYNEKSVGLICENCDRIIPIANDSDELPTKAFHTFSHHDDDSMYELRLVEAGSKREELISCLQQMLALNRNQVKDMLEELPVNLMQGIPKMKAEMLKAQLEVHDARAEFLPMSKNP